MKVNSKLILYYTILVYIHGYIMQVHDWGIVQICVIIRAAFITKFILCLMFIRFNIQGIIGETLVWNLGIWSVPTDGKLNK